MRVVLELFRADSENAVVFFIYQVVSTNKTCTNSQLLTFVNFTKSLFIAIKCAISTDGFIDAYFSVDDDGFCVAVAPTILTCWDHF